jgi:16S rRNA (uracil1498-N3)-methyltransferase
VSRRLYLDPARFALDTAELDTAAAHRVRDVWRLRACAALAVFDGLGHERAATVAATGRDGVTLALGVALTPLPEPPVPLTLACAFPRGGRGDWLVEKATELGVAHLLPLAADRSVQQPGAGRLERWRRIAIEAAEQCGRAVVPQLGGELPPRALALVADPQSATAPREALAALPPPAALVLHIGPEGGWSPAERERLHAAGAVPCSLGPRVLRVETAALVALAQLLELTGGLRPRG